MSTTQRRITKKDDNNNKDYVNRDMEGRTYKEQRYLHDDYRVNVDVREVAATIR